MVYFFILISFLQQIYGLTLVNFVNNTMIKVLGIQYLQECINFEIRIGGKLCRFVSLYRSPSQSQNNFETFAINFELNIDTATANNPALAAVLVDFNTKSNL